MKSLNVMEMVAVNILYQYLQRPVKHTYRYNPVIQVQPSHKGTTQSYRYNPVIQVQPSHTGTTQSLGFLTFYLAESELRLYE